MTTRNIALLAPMLLASASVSAEGRFEVIVDLLSRVPAEIFSGEVPESGISSIYFADHEAALASLDPLPAGVNPDWVEGHGGLARLVPPRLGRHLLYGAEAKWERLVGFAPLEVTAHLAVDAPPTHGMVLRLVSDAVSEVAPALRAAGYAEEDRDGVLALVRGSDGEPTDNGDPADLFSGGRNGWPSRVVMEGDTVLQSNSWPLLLGMANQSSQSHPDLVAMAIALDAEDWGAFQLVQAEVWADQRAIAPASSHGGIPAWNLGVLTDLGEGDATLTLLLLSYSDRAAAEAAAARIEEGWDEELPGGAPMHQITGVTAEVRILGEGPFVTVVAMEAPLAVETGWPSNSIYRALSEQGYGEYLALVGPE